jgi:hypothetical protein
MKEVVKKSLKTLSESCSRRGWDGKSAQPVASQVFDAALAFFSKMPPRFPSPSFSVTSQGTLIAEWGGLQSSALRIRFAKSGPPAFEARVGGRVKNGVLPDPEYFASILKAVLNSKKEG